MKHLFIVNPAAGGRHSRWRETRDAIEEFMDQLGLPYEIYITRAPMDACDKIRGEAARSPAPLRIYACGGDGTLNECINGAAGQLHVSVTHYPIGTGNDFVKTFGKEDAALFRDLSALVAGFTRPIDLINAGGRYGVNICSVGIDARIGADVHKYSGIPLIGGATGYVVSMLVNFIRGISQKLCVTTEAGRFSGRFALLCACNGRYYGGGFNPVPDAMPDDGLIDFLLIRSVSRLTFARVIGKYAAGRYAELGGIITHIRGNTVHIESEEEIVVNIDGEMIYAQNVSFSVIAGGVNFFFPAGMQFFEGHVLHSEDIRRKRVI